MKVQWRKIDNTNRREAVIELYRLVPTFIKHIGEKDEYGIRRHGVGLLGQSIWAYLYTIYAGTHWGCFNLKNKMAIRVKNWLIWGRFGV